MTPVTTLLYIIFCVAMIVSFIAFLIVANDEGAKGGLIAAAKAHGVVWAAGLLVLFLALIGGELLK